MYGWWFRRDRGPRRRTWMRQVAHRAGLPRPRLVEAPVAVAEHLLATGVQWPVGSFFVVCDIGAGAEVTVLRRGPAGGEVLATLSDPAAGGTAIDRALAAALTGEQEAAGAGTGDWAVSQSIRAVKEAPTVHSAVTVPLPDRPPVVAHSAMLQDAAGPVLQRVGQLACEAIAAAEVTAADLAGVYCVGGSASLPQVAAVIAAQTGVTATVVDEPGLAAAHGAAGARALGSATAGVVESPVPPVRRAVAIAVPGFASLALIAQ